MGLGPGQHGESLRGAGRFDHPTPPLGQRALGGLAHDVSPLDDENRVRRSHAHLPMLKWAKYRPRARTSTVRALTRECRRIDDDGTRAADQ
jgi:hypothetical protein